MINELRWLWAVWKLRRAYQRDGALFSERLALLRAARPRIKDEPGMCIDYPDAFFHMKSPDIARAIEISRDREKRIIYLNTTDIFEKRG